MIEAVNVPAPEGLQGERTLEDPLTIRGHRISNRLFLGTGKFGSPEAMGQALRAARAEVTTVALRRVDPAAPGQDLLAFVPEGCKVMANTSGARNVEEAVRLARLARAAGAGDWIKVEVIADQRYLTPDNLETLRATEILVKEGFTVFPYMSPDLAMGRRMAEAGAVAVMPLGSPIGSNRGFRTRELVEIMVREIPAPIIVDAGLGTPSAACECMELGCAAVLVNTAIAVAGDPPAYAEAFRLAVEAGRKGYLAGLPAVREGAEASSPLTGFLEESFA